jgi:hypothetical protein
MYSQSKRVIVAFVVSATIAAVSPVALAQNSVRFGITGFGGYNTYGMTDVNDAVDEVNADPDITAAGISLSQISGGFGVGGGIEVRPTEAVVLSVDYERLIASTKDEGSVLGTPVSVELQVPANAFVLTGAYLFPSASKSRFGLGGGVGYYKTSGTLEVSGGGGSVSDEVNGSGVGVHFLGVMDYAASGQIHLHLRAGYRMAKTSDLEDSAGNKLYNTDGSESQAEWSGLMTRAGVTVFLGSPQ